VEHDGREKGEGRKEEGKKASSQSMTPLPFRPLSPAMKCTPNRTGKGQSNIFTPAAAIATWGRKRENKRGGEKEKRKEGEEG